MAPGSLGFGCIAPTVLVDVSPDSPIMQEEVFGPILPVLEIDSVEAVVEWVNRRPRPLGLYVFADDLGVAERILDETESGDRRDQRLHDPPAGP